MGGRRAARPVGDASGRGRGDEGDPRLAVRDSRHRRTGKNRQSSRPGSSRFRHSLTSGIVRSARRWRQNYTSSAQPRGIKTRHNGDRHDSCVCRRQVESCPHPNWPPAGVRRKRRCPATRTRPAHRAPIAAAHFVDDAFFRHLVAHMRNGVLAINRAGELVLDQRRGVPHLRPAGRRGLSRPAVRRGVPRASRRRPGAGRRLRAGLPAQPRRAAARGRRTRCSATRCRSSATAKA